MRVDIKEIILPRACVGASSPAKRRAKERESFMFTAVSLSLLNFMNKNEDDPVVERLMSFLRTG
eukprot:15016954-Ditylum_brightwellii.AAC.1